MEGVWWLVDDERRGRIWQKSATKVTEFKCCKLVPNALLLWEPVKFFQKWYDMITLQFFHNKLGSIIPEFFVGLRFVHSQHLQNGITVVQSQGDHGRDTLRDWMGSKKWTNQCNFPDREKHSTAKAMDASDQDVLHGTLQSSGKECYFYQYLQTRSQPNRYPLRNLQAWSQFFSVFSFSL